VTGWLSRRLAPPALSGKPPRDLALEGLRGICACLVLYAHMTIPSRRLDPGYAPSGVFWWFNLGSVAVLFFFVLSGYVIGLTVRGPCSGPAARGYLGRRALRLIPVNTAAVLLAWALLPQVTVGTVLGNLGFLQNFRPYAFGWQVDVMPDNLNLWSLNFEALYYIGFLAVWALAPRAGWVAGLLVLLAATAALPGEHVVASCYAFGALYWLAGLSVAWLAPKAPSTGNWPSAMLAVLVMWPLAPLRNLLYSLHVPDRVAPLPLPSLHRLDLLPALVWLLLAVTGRAAAWQRRLGLFCLACATAGFARGLYFGDTGETGAMVCYGAAIALAWGLLRWEPAASSLGRLAPLGAVSFAVYAVAFPIEYGLYRNGWLPVGSAPSYALRALLLATVTFGVAWILDIELQPLIRRAFRPAPPPG
jgi:peptidoglycan/LPS O-acetylase OafA/YrhL